MTPPNLDGMSRPHQAFWNTSVAEMLQKLHTTAKGLTGDEARVTSTWMPTPILRCSTTGRWFC